ncbi:hypothetical protein J416_04928 [Gracilibacillus halophilus YIM-C55.5]|uniref:DUF2487 family protein n=1 Tax=Gracilibacillus halophilus YIM-C55.5 TaxID=1308866 RepID=N4WSF8_9BACI|nr:DUF2487 family protein [Gracilibacillus halophilus]ENH97330.1 hypothetical protein J416_04928 [Gracilibacillus halophilus YIM-C55.5]
MKWETSSIETFFQEQQYIDTLCIPLLPVTFKTESDAKKYANQAELLQILTHELERDFMGRIFLSTPYTYFVENDYDEEVQRINQWTEEMGDKFRHKFLLTFDVHWKKREGTLSSTLIWLPSRYIENVDSNEAKEWVTDQKSQVSELIQSFW